MTHIITSFLAFMFF
ncbi:hypothetical protein ACVH4P_004436 [Escherichia coli]